ncbi:HRDC domain-containing protein [Clostridium sp. DSM 100503]|nr:HRDC domain-containing protein [Clostridium sp. DSM 100503]MCR1953178.1 HRDC domain-containing protein [Clostridium sp. DSM 100503]
MPKTKSELKDVSGFGEVKIEKYGDGILKILNE